MNSEYLEDKKGYFIATCAVTDKAKQKWIKFVKDIFKIIKEDEKVYISGCSAFKD
jgi:tRNA A37 methylthiotransferase MiaB